MEGVTIFTSSFDISWITVTVTVIQQLLIIHIKKVDTLNYRGGVFVSLDKFIYRMGILLGIIFFPTLFKRPTYKLWVPFFLWNGLVNVMLDTYLVKTNKVKYPVRFKPRKFKINIIYDVFICPYLSVWYCQSTYNDKLLTIIKKLFLWGLPQSVYEILLERKTNTLKFQMGYKWYHSLFLVFVVKILSRLVFELIKTFRTLQSS